LTLTDSNILAGLGSMGKKMAAPAVDANRRTSVSRTNFISTVLRTLPTVKAPCAPDRGYSACARASLHNVVDEGNRNCHCRYY
jgi:hypothetical protein